MHKFLPKFFIFLDQYNSEIFENNNINIGIIYRNYKDRNRENQLTKIAKACKKSRYKLFVSNDIKLVHKVKADGIYIPSFNKNLKVGNFNLKKDFIVLGSAHNIKEINEKEKQKVDAIFLSTLFKTNKSNDYLDLSKFNFLSKFSRKKIIALGGISEKNINKLKLLKCDGFASISFIKISNKKCIVSNLLKK